MRNMTVLAMALVILLGLTTVSIAATTWTVKSGQTLGSISKQTGVSVQEIAKVNNIRNIHQIRKGQQLIIPEKVTRNLTSLPKFSTPSFHKSEKLSFTDAVIHKTSATATPVKNFEEKRETLIVKDVQETPPVQKTPAVKEMRKDIATMPEGDVEKIVGKFASVNNEPLHETGSRIKHVRPFELGKSFNELALTAGFGKNIESSAFFGYTLLEGVHWREQKDAGRNLGVGGLILLDGWRGENDARSSALSVMGQLGWYEIIGKTENTHLLVKPRFGAKIHLDGSEEKINPVIGVYAEADHKTSVQNRIGITIDSIYEIRTDKDGYASGRVFFEHTFENKMRLLVGVGPVVHWSGDQTDTGFSPALSLRIPFDRNNALTVGILGDFTGGERNSIGAFATYAWDDIRYKEKVKK